MTDGTYCPMHNKVEAEIAEVKATQRGRLCQTNTEKITQLEKTDVRLEQVDTAQWETINQLRKVVYMGAGAAGVLAFLGSILGTFLRK